jgi:predicted nucleic acid-binding Zn ribbon protein
MNYDDWKLETPDTPAEKECDYCGEPSDKRFCSTSCKKAYDADN